jgi:hypothetical protein
MDIFKDSHLKSTVLGFIGGHGNLRDWDENPTE